MSSDSIKILALLVGNVLSSASLSIIVPIIVTYYESLYFIAFIASLEFLIIFGIILFLIPTDKSKVPREWSSIIQSGLYNNFMAVALIYVANPARTPIVVQVVLSGLVILPSVLFTRIILHKNVTYDWKCWLSIIFLLISIAISLIPEYAHWKSNIMELVWVLIFIFGVVCRSAYSIMQEKYLTESADFSFLNKIILVFYSRIFQLVTLIPLFGLEYGIGYTKHPLEAVKSSFQTLYHDTTASLLLQAYIGIYLIMYVVSVYLNAISTNYNMISTVASNPITIGFFAIFPKLNKGTEYPFWIIVICIVASTTSILLWVSGEKKVGGAEDIVMANGYHAIKDADEEKNEK